jgi:hypothetical protein
MIKQTVEGIVEHESHANDFYFETVRFASEPGLPGTYDTLMGALARVDGRRVRVTIETIDGDREGDDEPSSKKDASLSGLW